MEQAHRKIELQAPADLTYLLNNASRRARERIDVHFPPANNESQVTAAINTSEAPATSNSTANAASELGSGFTATSLASIPVSKSTEAGKDSRTDGEVDMRTRVEELVQTYIDDTFRAVRGNVSVNGLDGSDLDALMSNNQAEGMYRRLLRGTTSILTQSSHILRNRSLRPQTRKAHPRHLITDRVSDPPAR